MDGSNDMAALMDDADTSDTAHAPPASSQPAASSSSLGQLLLDLTTQVQDERKRRGDVEKRNHALMLELDQLQREVLDLRTTASVNSEGNGGSHGRRRHSTTDIEPITAAASDRLDQAEDDDSSTNGAASPPASFLCRELQGARAAKDRALVESHQRALQVLELSACVSMQHDELSALRSSTTEAQAALTESERVRGDVEREKALVDRELALAREDAARLAREVGARGEHVATLMEKWTEAQARSEHLERQRDEAAGKVSAALARGDDLARQREQLVDERDCLQHQVNHLKGAVAAKSAESRAFQAFGSHAREHLQVQNAVLQRHLVLRRSVHARASEALSEVRTLRVQLSRELRAPMLALQADFHRFVASLRAPVMNLVANADRYARVAHAEHVPLREALTESEQARRHLHDQLWRARRDAAIVAQVVQQPAEEAVGPSSASSSSMEQIVRANFHSGELLMLRRPTAEEGSAASPARATNSTLPSSTAILRRVRCDTLYSDRSRAWSAHESVAPLIQSLLDGRNACVITVAGASDLVTKPVGYKAAAGADAAAMPAIKTVLTELFGRLAGTLTVPTSMRRARLSLSLLAVFNEAVYDLLGLDAVPPASSVDSKQQQTNHMVVVEVQTLEEALLVLKGARETLDAAGERGALFPPLTHTVVTVCLTLEDRQTPIKSGAVIRSKLQLVELALPLDQEEENGNVSLTISSDRDRVRQQVAATSSVRALCLALAGVRLASERDRYSPGRSNGVASGGDAASFVRFHGSKLTVLLQDTLRSGGKLLTLVAVPSRAHVGSPAARMAAATLRLLEQLRLAVGDGLGGLGGSSHNQSDRPIAMDLMGTRDRSLETFMSRLALHQAQHSGEADESASALVGNSVASNSSAPLAFSSQDMRDDDKRRLSADSAGSFGSLMSWEAGLEAMTRRYGGKAALDELLVAIQQQQQQQLQLSFAPASSPLPSPTRSQSSPPRSPSRSSLPAPASSASAGLLLGFHTSGDLRGSLSTDDALDNAVEGDNKPRHASLSTPRGLQHRGSGGGRNYKAGTSSSMRKSRARLSIVKPKTASHSSGASSRKLSGGAASKPSKSDTVRAAGPVSALALRAQAAPARSGAVVSLGGRVRRETASSALKKSRLASAAQKNEARPFR